MLLFEVSLGQVLQLSLGEAQVVGACHGDLRAIARDDYVGLGEVTNLSLHLDAFIEVLLEGGNVKDLVVNRGRTVNDVLDSGLLR